MKRRLLIVEDEPVLARTVAALLDPDSYLISWTGDGLQAARLVETEKPDIILSDLVMPGMDGYRLLRWVRDTGVRSPFILMTVKSSAFGPISRGRPRPDFFLNKPFDRKGLLEAMAAAEARLKILGKAGGDGKGKVEGASRARGGRNVPKR